MDFGYLRAIEGKVALALGVPPEPAGQAAKLGVVAIGSSAWATMLARSILVRTSDRSEGPPRQTAVWQ